MQAMYAPRLLLRSLPLCCSYYLHSLGTPQDLVRFWLRHQLYEDAVRFFGARPELSGPLLSRDRPDPAELFFDVILASLRDGAFDALRRFMQRLDGTLSLWHPLLSAVVDRLFDAQLFDALLDFQRDCNCPFALAQTALHYFNVDSTLPPQLQLRLLEAAREALGRGTAPPPPPALS